jgi:hypothetical protein
MAFRPTLSRAGLAAGACLLITACSSAQPETRASERSDGGPLRAVARLTCPQRAGSLTLVSAAADGRSCAYQGAEQSHVAIRLLPLDGQTPEIALAPIEAELRARLPMRPPPAVPVSSGQGVNINLPGVNVDADDEGANIRIGGLHVSADPDRARIRLDRDGDDADDDSHADRGERPVVRRTSGGGDVVIDAHENGAEVRVSEPGRGVRMTYILASSEQGPGGDRFVAYDARGPSAGPLVVATLRSPGDNRSGPLTSMKRLVRLNVGG